LASGKIVNKDVRGTRRSYEIDLTSQSIGIRAWVAVGRPSGLFITKDDMIYVADSLSSAQNNPGFKNGIRWGHISDGKVLGFIPWGEYNAIEAVAVDDKPASSPDDSLQPSVRALI